MEKIYHMSTNENLSLEKFAVKTAILEKYEVLLATPVFLVEILGKLMVKLFLAGS